MTLEPNPGSLESRVFDGHGHELHSAVQFSLLHSVCTIFVAPVEFQKRSSRWLCLKINFLLEG